MGTKILLANRLTMIVGENSLVALSDLARGAYWVTCGMRLGDDDPPSVIMEVNSRLHQYYGTLHGGAVAGLLDAAVGVAVHSILPPDKGAVTVEMKINFLKPTVEGTLEGRGRILNQGKLLLTGQSEVRNSKGELVAVALATFRIIDLA